MIEMPEAVTIARQMEAELTGNRDCQFWARE